MILFNPSTENVSIVVKGITYEIAAGKKSVDLRDDVAETWLLTHEFLFPADQIPAKAEVVKPEVKADSVVVASVSSAAATPVVPAK